MRPPYEEVLESISAKHGGDAGLLEHVTVGLREAVSSVGWVRFHGDADHVQASATAIEGVLASLPKARSGGTRVSVAFLPFVDPSANDQALIGDLMRAAATFHGRVSEKPEEESHFQILAGWLEAVRNGRGVRKLGGPFALTRNELFRLETERLSFTPFTVTKEPDTVREARGEPVWIQTEVIW